MEQIKISTIDEIYNDDNFIKFQAFNNAFYFLNIYMFCVLCKDFILNNKVSHHHMLSLLLPVASPL